MDTTKTVTCQICKASKGLNDAMPVDALRPSLAETIQKRAPAWDPHGFICLSDLDNFRRDYVQCVLEDELGDLSKLEQEVVESLKERELLSENINAELSKELTFGERLSDKIASFGG